MFWGIFLIIFCLIATVGLNYAKNALYPPPPPKTETNPPRHHRQDHQAPSPKDRRPKGKMPPELPSYWIALRLACEEPTSGSSVYFDDGNAGAFYLLAYTH